MSFSLPILVYLEKNGTIFDCHFVLKYFKTCNVRYLQKQHIIWDTSFFGIQLQQRQIHVGRSTITRRSTNEFNRRPHSTHTIHPVRTPLPLPRATRYRDTAVGTRQQVLRPILHRHLPWRGNIPSAGVRSPLVFVSTVQLARDRQLKTIPNYINQQSCDNYKKPYVLNNQ